MFQMFPGRSTKIRNKVRVILGSEFHTLRNSKKNVKLPKPNGKPTPTPLVLLGPS